MLTRTRRRVAASGTHVGEQVEQAGIVGLALLGRMRPVAAPDHPLGGRRDQGLRDCGRVRVSRRPDLGVEIGAGQLDPGAAGIDQPVDDGEGRVIDASGLRQAAHVVGRLSSRQQPLKRATWLSAVDDLVAAHMDLHVPAQFVHAPRQRLDHVERGGRGRGIELGEADAAHATGVETPELAVADVGMHHRDPARGVAELGDGVQRHRVVDRIHSRRHDHDPSHADAPLQQPVLGDGAIGLHARLRPLRREARIIDVHVAIAGVHRRAARQGGALPAEFGTACGPASAESSGRSSIGWPCGVRSAARSQASW